MIGDAAGTGSWFPPGHRSAQFENHRRRQWRMMVFANNIKHIN